MCGFGSGEITGGHMSRTKTAVLDFTADEHTVLSAWFNSTTPEPESETPEVAAALERLGCDDEAHHYTRHQAAVARILLERVDRRLPQWLGWIDGTVVFARKPRDRSKLVERSVLASIRHLFTINWATSGPSIEWPLAYHLAWVPTYDRFVVTASSDPDEVFGYADFALGSFAATPAFVERAGEVIKSDWKAPARRLGAGAVGIAQGHWCRQPADCRGVGR